MAYGLGPVIGVIGGGGGDVTVYPLSVTPDTSTFSDLVTFEVDAEAVVGAVVEHTYTGDWGGSVSTGTPSGLSILDTTSGDRIQDASGYRNARNRGKPLSVAATLPAGEYKLQIVRNSDPIYTVTKATLSIVPIPD